MNRPTNVKHARTIAFGLALMAVPITGFAQPPQPGAAQRPAGAGEDPGAFRRAQEEFNKVPNTPGDGPYPALLETDPSLPNHVIYRPANLAPFAGGKLPVLAWGNGGCADDGTAHRLYLAQIASYGYLVIAAGGWRSGPGATEKRAPQAATPGGGLPPAATTTADVKAGLDWAVAQNKVAGSRFSGKVAVDKLAAAGHSCGGLQAIELAADPRIKTIMVNNSGIFNSGRSTIPGMSVSKDMLEKFHTPVLYLLGGPSDVAYPNGTDDYKRISKVPVVLADLPVGHGATFNKPMGGAVAHVAVDWLEWQLKGDKSAARTFMGANCRLCAGTEWTIEHKGF
jgi:dienelactone hydrolase